MSSCSELGARMILCLNCGSRKVDRTQVTRFVRTRCRTCDFGWDADLDGEESIIYQHNGKTIEVPEGCFLVVSWEPE